MRHVILVIAFGSLLTIAPVSANNEATAATAAAPKADPDQKIKCRMVEVTGSLVRKGRVCKTIAQWKAIIGNGNAIARTMVEDGTTRPAGN